MSANPLQGLGEAEKRVLSYAASMGKEFDWSVLLAASETDEEQLAEILERLVHLGILRELNWGDSYAFAQVVTLAQAYSEISSSRLRVIHKKIAEAYEKQYPEPTPDIIPEMGRQFHLGRVHEKSLPYNRYAAALAANAFSPDIAVRYLERAKEDLEALPGDHRLEEADVLKEMGEMYDAMGNDARADELYGESLRKLPEGEVILRALILLSRADAARVMDRIGPAHQYCEEAIRLLEKAGHKKGLALAHRNLARTAYLQERYELGRKEIEATLSFLDPEKDAKDVARCSIEFGNLLSSMPDPADQARGVEYYYQAIQALETQRDYRELARAYTSLAVALLNSHPGEAVANLEKARTAAEKCKDMRLVGWTLFNTVEPLIALNRGPEAAQNNAEARRVLSKVNDQLGLQQVALNDGIIAQHQKSFEESEKAYMESLKQAEGLDYARTVAEVLVHLAMMYADWGRVDEAMKVIARTKETGEDHIDPVVRLSYEALKRRLGT
jgi:hypothetical protein